MNRVEVLECDMPRAPRKWRERRRDFVITSKEYQNG